jgi:hypothetical protein
MHFYNYIFYFFDGRDRPRFDKSGFPADAGEKSYQYREEVPVIDPRKQSSIIDLHLFTTC